MVSLPAVGGQRPVLCMLVSLQLLVTEWLIVAGSCLWPEKVSVLSCTARLARCSLTVAAPEVRAVGGQH